MHTKFWSEIPKRRYYSKDVDLDEKMISGFVLRKWGEKEWTGCM
jgi:hypothetical protein